MYDILSVLSLLCMIAGMLTVGLMVAYSIVFCWFSKYRLDGAYFKVVLFDRIVVWKIAADRIEMAYILEYYVPLRWPHFTVSLANRITTRRVVLKRVRRRFPFLSSFVAPDIDITPRNPEEFVEQFNQWKAALARQPRV